MTPEVARGDRDGSVGPLACRGVFGEVLVVIGVVDRLSRISQGEVGGLAFTVFPIVGATDRREVRHLVDERAGARVGSGVRRAGVPEDGAQVKGVRRWIVRVHVGVGRRGTSGHRAVEIDGASQDGSFHRLIGGLDAVPAGLIERPEPRGISRSFELSVEVIGGVREVRGEIRDSGRERRHFTRCARRRADRGNRTWPHRCGESRPSEWNRRKKKCGERHQLSSRGHCATLLRNAVVAKRAWRTGRVSSTSGTDRIGIRHCAPSG